MPTVDNWRALREALEAGPTEGPWFYISGDEWSHSIATKHEPLPDGSPSFWTVADINKRREPEHKANAKLIAAADPTTIRALLDERDRLATDAQNCKELIWALARELKCLPSTFSDANGHVLKAAIALNSERDRLEKDVALLNKHHAAWGNAQLTKDLLAAAAERDRLAAEVEALRADRAGVLLNVIQALNQNPYSLTKYECIDLVEAMRDEAIDAARGIKEGGAV